MITTFLGNRKLSVSSCSHNFGERKKRGQMNKNESKNLAVIETASKGGRPSKYQPESVKRLLSAIADGLTLKQSCIATGICENTLANWRERHPELESRLMQARETARQKALATIKAAGENGDWRASAEFLKLSFQSDYRRDANINVSATATTQQVGVVCDEATRATLIEQRRRLLADARDATHRA